MPSAIIRRTSFRRNLSFQAMNPFPRHIPPLGPPKASPRERVLAAWRGIDLTAEEKARGKSKAAGAVLPQVLKEARMESRLAEAEIVKVWNGLMDTNVTAHAQPAGLLRNGTLLVNVDSHVWLDEIVRYRRREILDRLRHSFGMELSKKISFRVG